MLLKNMVETVYAAKRRKVQLEADTISAIRRGDRNAAARAQYEIQQIQTSVLREYRIIL